MRAAPTRSARSSRRSTQEAAATPLAHVFWICGRAGDARSVGSLKSDVNMRANAGQGRRMDSSGRVSRLLNGSGGTCEREGAGGVRPMGAVARRARAHRTAGGAGFVSNRRRGDLGV